jgi:opacity protein-like surface antigen
MQLTRRLLAGAAAVVLTTSAASAAEPMYTPPSMAPGAPMMPPPAPYNWSGFYVGGFVGSPTIFLPAPAAGLQVGFNFQPGNFVVGVEGRVGRIIGAPPPNTFNDARLKAGITFGQSGNVWLYGVGSVGTVLTVGAPYYTFGGGVEFGIGRVSVFAESVVIGFGGPPVATAFQGGLNFHFN